MIRIVLNDERPMSWNKLYSGAHWSVREAEARRVHTLIKYAKKEIIGSDEEPISPVDITITAYFKNRPYDCDNIATKLYIDGLKGSIIKNDTPDYVHSVTAISMIDKKNPRMEIEIE